MKVLYSPIGTTDPILNNYDGPWLHICRYIAPDLCILFLTNKICGYNEKFERVLELMSEQLIKEGKRKTPIKIEFRAHEEIDKPHLYNQFDKYFENDIKEIMTRFPDCELYCNGGSGTPAMKSCIDVMYHFLPYDMILCRVENSPKNAQDEHEAGFKEKVNIKDYDPDKSWNDDLDKEPGAKNRLILQTKSEITPLGRKIKLLQMKELIKKYEYASAELLFQREHELFSKEGTSEKLSHALNGALARTHQDLETARDELQRAGYKEIALQMMKADDLLAKSAEGILLMQVESERKQYANFLRFLTPVLFTLVKCALAMKGIDINDWCNVTPEGKARIQRYKLISKAPQYENVIFRADEGSKQSVFPETSRLLDVVKKECDAALFQLLSELRDVESDARNFVAHELLPVTEEWVKNETNGKTVDDVLKILKEVIKKLDKSGRYSSNYFNAYSNMNDYMAGLIDE